jgi:hypothetical protein
MKTLLSLFDYSGQWSEPFARRGWNVIQWDIKLAEFMDINLIKDSETALDMFENVDGILAACPCTDFASSGAQYWSAKDASGQTAKSLELVYQTQRLADLFAPTDPEYYEDGGTFFWAVENPVGRLGRLAGLGKAFYFDPYEYAGLLKPSFKDRKELDRIRLKDGKGVTQEEADLIERLEAYTKKTCLWGDFSRDLVKYPIEPAKACEAGSPLMRKGGKSAKTKEERSFTPSGFAEAFYQANKNHQAEIC